jgi:hypothetical protein
MTLGNGDKRHFAVLPDDADQKADNRSALKSDSSDNSRLQLIMNNESLTASEILQEFGLQKQALLAPVDILQSNLDSIEKHLLGIKVSYHQAENRFDHEITAIFTDFEQYAYKRQKYAVCKTNGIVDKAYSDNYHNCIDELQHVLNSSLREGVGEAMAPLYIDMAQYMHDKLNQAWQRFIESTETLLGLMYQQAVAMFGLQREIKIKIPLIKSKIPIYIESDEGAFTEPSPDLPAGTLPDSFVYPLLLTEIKMRIPVEVEKRFHDFNLYCWNYLQRTSCDLKNRMFMMVEETDKQLRLLLDHAVIQMENRKTSI